MDRTDELKNELRAEMKKMRSSMDGAVKKRLDDRIFENLLRRVEFANAEKVLVYKSTDTEVGTDKIIGHCLDKKISVALPRCFGKGLMKFYLFNGGDELEKSSYGIYEPPENERREVTDFENTVCIVPALAIDSGGYRLGYGGGYYDRFLAAHEEVLPIVICYSENITDRLVHNKYDRRAALAVTEKGPEVYQ